MYSTYHSYEKYCNCMTGFGAKLSCGVSEEWLDCVDYPKVTDLGTQGTNGDLQSRPQYIYQSRCTQGTNRDLQPRPQYIPFKKYTRDEQGSSAAPLIYRGGCHNSVPSSFCKT